MPHTFFTLRIELSENSCAVHWSATCESDLSADALTEIFESFYLEGLRSLASICTSGNGASNNTPLSIHSHSNVSVPGLPQVPAETPSPAAVAHSHAHAHAHAISSSRERAMTSDTSTPSAAVPAAAEPASASAAAAWRLFAGLEGMLMREGVPAVMKTMQTHTSKVTKSVNECF